MRCADPVAALRRLLAIATLALLAACGGGGGDGDTAANPSASTPAPAPTPALTNVATVTVDDGPTELGVDPGGYRAANIPYVDVTICVPGTTTCQTIDHVQVDTGSVGLRIVREAIGASLAAALPQQRSASGNPVGECYGFVSGYVFGSVRGADVQIGGARAANIPIHVIADGGVFATVPQSCSSGGGDRLATIKDLGAKGILGIGSTATDCGPFCTTAGGSGAAVYYDCAQSGCGAVIARAANRTAPFEQLPHFAAALATDNNGTLLDIPAAGAGGARTLSGRLYFGIGTQTNNQLAGARILTLSETQSDFGNGYLTVVYQGRTLPLSFVDSGSNGYIFGDDGIANCTRTPAFYCPPSPLALAASLRGQNGAVADGGFTLQNAQTLFDTENAALPGLGIDPNAASGLQPIPNSFDYGFPFFIGRRVFTAIEGSIAAGTPGPYVAF